MPPCSTCGGTEPGIPATDRIDDRGLAACTGRVGRTRALLTDVPPRRPGSSACWLKAALCRGRVSGSVPADRTGDDGRLAVSAVSVPWLLRSSAHWMYLWPGFPVVVGSPYGVVEHRVGGEDLLQCRVRPGALWFVIRCAGVRMVAAKQRAVGVPDLDLGGARRNPQDGVKVGPLSDHDRNGGLRWRWFVAPAGSGRGHGARRAFAWPAGSGAVRRGRRALRASDARVWNMRAGRTVTS